MEEQKGDCRCVSQAGPVQVNFRTTSSSISPVPHAHPASTTEAVRRVQDPQADFKLWHDLEQG